MTMPGVGPLTAVSYVAALENPDTFKRSRAVGAWLGLTPRGFQSGEVDYDGHISRRGDRQLRAAMPSFQMDLNFSAEIAFVVTE
jgi:transposase